MLLHCGDSSTKADPPLDGGVTCDPAKDSACLDNGIAVFVASTGLDSADGTKEHPVQSIQTALSKAASAGKSRVYVCDGSYAERVKIDRPISVYGGFACTGAWTYTGARAKIAPGESGPALEVRNVAGAIVVADLEFTAKNATSPGESSIAGWVSQSGGVTFRRVKLTAGTGADANSTPVTIPDWVPPKALDGNSADGGAPGGEQPNPCSGLTAPSDRSVGGPGGNRNSDGGSGLPKIPEKPAGSGNTGAGGNTAMTGCSGIAFPGAYGVGGVQASEGTALGQVGPNGYVSASGATGGNGVTGQGGGGGAGKAASTAYGGGGGAGGCGGKGGVGGQAGGSSIALLVHRMKVTLESTTLHADKGGQGGPGGKGQKAQQGGTEGNSGGFGGCPGAQGGHGGSGAGGNGGAGGSSFNLAYVGDAPSIDGADVTDKESLTDKGWSLPSSSSNGGGAGDKGERVVLESDEGQPGRPGPHGITKAVVPLAPAP
ncbi:hypothetical protein [Pendulispora albinea]|uniref:DUF1565 domain-containing protein n=1 Tax=Pendulispora albinea TaxID=2741071 RepID=A0ABZ2MD21_9BACT